jgi:hypothetical protein
MMAEWAWFTTSGELDLHLAIDKGLADCGCIVHSSYITSVMRRCKSHMYNVSF